MKKQYVLFTTLALVVIAVWYVRGLEAVAPESAIQALSTPDDSPSGAPQNIDDEQHARHLQKLKGLLAIRNMERKLAAHQSSATDDLTEDEQMAEMTNTRDQIAWRRDWTEEAQDEEWTRRMKEAVKVKAGTLLAGKIGIRDLSCRETVCRMYLQFEDKIDAESFISSEGGSYLQYEYQLLNPDNEDEPDIEKERKYNYEVLVKRDRPGNLPKIVRPGKPASNEMIVAANPQEEDLDHKTSDSPEPLRPKSSRDLGPDRGHLTGPDPII